MPLLARHGLKLSEMTLKLSSIDVNAIVRLCPNLEKLSLQFCLPQKPKSRPCARLQQSPLPALPLKRLKTLNLIYNELGFVDKRIFSLLSCPALTSVRVDGANGRTLPTLLNNVLIERHAFPYLEELKLDRCRDITLEDLLPIIEDATNPLKRVSFNMCKGIHLKAVVEYQQRMKKTQLKKVEYTCRGLATF